jgi:hypothetical protein
VRLLVIPWMRAAGASTRASVVWGCVFQIASRADCERRRAMSPVVRWSGGPLKGRLARRSGQ